MSIQPPPNFENAIDDNGKFKMAWKLFFQQLFDGDTGNTWTPTFTSLAYVTSPPVVTGRYYKLGKFCIAEITITASDTTASTAGVTYCDFPLVMQGNGIVFAVAANTGGGTGMCNSTTNRIYPPTWAPTANTITLLALVRAT